MRVFYISGAVSNPAVDDGPAYTVNGNCDGLPKFAGNTGNPAEAEQLPEGYALFQNYPNPFNPKTEITFAFPEAVNINLAIYNTSGQLVRTLVSGQTAAGYHTVTWDATDENGVAVASGVYFYTFRAGKFIAHRKLMLVR